MKVLAVVADFVATLGASPLSEKKTDTKHTMDPTCSKESFISGLLSLLQCELEESVVRSSLDQFLTLC